MARVGHADEHDLAAEPLQRHEELLAFNDVAAQVGLTVHDEEGCVDRRRVGDRRAIDVSPDILPRWHATLLGDRPVPSDVARPEVRRDVVDRRLGARGLEALGVADDPARHEPAVADSDHSESPTVDERKTVERRSEEHTSELQSRGHLVCRLLLEKKKKKKEKIERTKTSQEMQHSSTRAST